MSGEAQFQFVRFKDPNEALGLAVRLLVGVDSGPFEQLPLGMSARMLTVLIDRGEYGFAKRAERAVGFAVWSFVHEDAAARYIGGTERLKVEEFGSGNCGIVFAFHAVDRATTRFLGRRLRDTVFARADSVSFVRDYGRTGARPPRAVVMRRRPAQCG